jgi:16S rRNA (adenine1518-N6/adenine1519-N6)-dimethyltransferase
VSAKVAYFAEGGVVGRVPAAVFVPKPKVESVLVRLIRHDPPTSCEGVDPAKLFWLIKQAFSQRRKMLRSTLRGQIDDQGFAAAQIDGQRRAESLNLDEFASLARQLA